MGRVNRKYLASERIFGCAKCRTHLAIVETLISRQFNGQHGRAFLFETVVNVNEGPAEDRNMTTGPHTVRDIYCSKCGTTVGWKYDVAYEPGEKYKENKFILEKALLCDVPPQSDVVATEEGDTPVDPS